MRKYNLRMGDIEFYDNKIYFSAQEFNGLFCTDICGGEAILLARFPEERNEAKRLHSAVVRFQDELLFLPDLSDHIVLYNIKKNVFENFDYPISPDKVAQVCLPKVASAIQVNHCAFFFGENYPCIIKFDFNTREMKVYEEWFQVYKEYGYRGGTFFCKDIGVIGKSIYARTHQNTAVIEFNTVTEKVCFYSVGVIPSSILCCDNDKIWLMENNERTLCCWSPSTNERNLFLFNGDLKYYECSVALISEIWMFPFQVNMPIMIFDKKNGSYKEKSFAVIGKENLNNISSYVRFRKKYNQCLFFMPVADNKLYCINADGKEQYNSEIFVEKDKFVNDIYGVKTNIIRENNGDSLSAGCNIEDFLPMICFRTDRDKESERATYATSGCKINEEILNMLRK